MNLFNRTLMESIRMERFKDIYDRFVHGDLNCELAADLLGCSVRHFKRLRNNYNLDGLDGLRDKRFGKPSPNKAADEEVELVTRLYKERYRDFSVKHFYEFLRQKHALHKSYSWTKNTLTSKGLISPSKRGGPHRLRRARSAMRGMMIHQDGSTHEWIPGVKWDLIVTMDDATSEIYSGFFVEEEGTVSSLQGVKDVIAKHGLFCTFYSDRGSHYFYTPEAGGKVDKNNLTQFGRALKQLNINHIAAYSPQARGRSERMFGTLQGRLPQEFALEGIKTMEEANKYMKDIYLPKHNNNFTVEPELDKSAFIPTVGVDLDNVLCIQEDRVVQNDNTVRYNKLILQIPANKFRHHFVKANVKVNKYLNNTMAIFHGPMMIGEYDTKGNIIKEKEGKKEIAA